MDLVEILDVVAESLSTPRGLDETLLAVTRSACDNLPGVDYASISILHPDGSLLTVASTDVRVDEADHWQYELREGPCYAAVTTDDVLISEDVADDARWPDYRLRIQHLGLRAQAAFPLFRHQGTHGALNLYSASTAAFSDPDHLIRLFRRQAAIALGHASEVDGLKEALIGRKVIGQAMGIVMERYHLDRAFEYLIRVSQTSNTKLRDVANHLVHTANDE
jgi:GAF domain-containing protein